MPITSTEVLHLKLTTAPLKDYREKEAPIIRHEWIGNVVEMSFANFNEPLGAVTNKPTRFAQSKTGSPIYYLAIVYRLSNYTKIELQIMMGGGLMMGGLLS
ncbi:hypothetical protein [Polaromonas sp. JS666]|uniref:hypothetical protein n=1 Tax=Polaromonas sp. (strain JS666 / ATCC BAA-500) TaxID=296591 RepID=UPI0011141CAD|nr:hypothetical protein [Polaromonas sp. JS666]